MLGDKFVVEWPWEVNYEEVNRISTDVLVIGGGIAGSWAAIKATQKGVKAAIVEQADVYTAGPGGCDHWVYALDNPACKLDPDEFIEILDLAYGGYFNGIAQYITLREGYMTLCELENMGAKIRDAEDEFKGAPFRDEKTKLLFAYDYENKHTIRVWGQTFRGALYNELLRNGVELYNRIYVTSLLTEDGLPGSRVVGAMGVNVRTGEFYVFEGKAVVICTGGVHDRIWMYQGYRFLPTVRLPSVIGSGIVLGWKAGAELTLMEGRISGPRRVTSGFPCYTTGRSYATWYPCNMVDAEGKEIPWVDGDGRPLTSFEQRVRPSLLGKKVFLERAYHPAAKEYRLPTSIDNLPIFEELIKRGEYKLPIYADLSSMPEYEKRVIFGLMLTQEGKTWISYLNLTRGGFDPDKDMLQCYENSGKPLDFASEGYIPYFGGLIQDWDFRTTVEGLFAAGDVLFCSHYHSEAAVCGRWAGAKAAEYAKTAPKPRIEENQVQSEIRRVYMPVKREKGISWKELNVGLCKVMRVYAGKYITEDTLNVALRWIQELKAKEAQELVARNPYELWRCLQVQDLLTLAEIIILAMRQRKASSTVLNFYRLDYPYIDPPEYSKFLTLRLSRSGIVESERLFRWWLKPPYLTSYKENYEKHNPWQR